MGRKPAGKEVAGGPLELVRIEHPKVVNSAYFSPVTGRKLMTTCIDNRLRIWDYLLSVNGEPDRQIVHSHDFNRYLSPFRAEWDPKDPDERLIVIGRYHLSSMWHSLAHPCWDALDSLVEGEGFGATLYTSSCIECQVTWPSVERPAPAGT